MCVCVFALCKVTMFMKHVDSWIYLWTQCNCYCFSVCLHILIVLSLGCSLPLLFFFPSHFLPLSTLYCCFFCLFVFPFLFPPYICTSPPSSPVFLGPFFAFLPSPGLVWRDGQETGGLSPAAGCGRHGEDARTGLEVCVYVPAGVLPGLGDKGPG